MSEGKKRKKGGQPGNQNGRRHGFYARIPDNKVSRYAAQARKIEGLDEEIALLRAKFRAILENDKESLPENAKIYLQAIDTLARVLKTRNNLLKTDKQDLKEGLTNIIRDIGIPMGIDLNTTIFK